MKLSPHETLHGFTVQSCEPLPEIDGTASVLYHEKSGAKLLYLENEDTNKAFSITFKTPPADDTGVFHILEHSVLCGSDKFPVKEPFVDLLKSSMQTFLNAMTFPDKTMYPVASTNDQDLENLVDVYMDAVLRPAIYHKRAIFEQEGWHFELESADIDEQVGESISSQDKPTPQLTFNGVVYNEMKGALSDPNSVLYDEIQTALFPDTPYRFESGGTPRAIPDLTYENYLDEHARHYRLNNSYLTLYGAVDLNRMLAFLDTAYLSPLADEEAVRDSARAAQGKAPLVAREVNLQPPVKNLSVVKTMDTAPENACIGLGYVAGHARDRARIIALDILIDALMGSNEAPVKRTLLDQNLGDDVQAFLADALLQPFVVIQAKGITPDTAQRFPVAVEEALRTTVEKGIDPKLIAASLSRAEFLMREREFGMADGVALSMAALSGWLYDDELATSYLHYEEDFAFFREQLETGYFENLITEVFLNNNHSALVEVRPTEEEDTYEATRLAQVESLMTPADFERVVQEEEALREHQMAPDTPEALATLPRLGVADIEQAPPEPEYALLTDTPVPCLRHAVPTRGISYAYRYYDLNRVSFEDLPYLTILGLMLGKLDTAQHTASELDTLVQGQLGNLSFFPEIYEDDKDPHALTPKFVVGASSLSENTSALSTLPLEIMLTTNFSDTSKIKDVLQQRRISMEQGFASSGHSAAMARVASYYLPAGVVRQQLGGVGFYRFLKELLAHFDERAAELSERLTTLAQQLFVDSGCVLSFTGSDEDFSVFWKAGGTTDRTAPDAQQLIIPEPTIRNEAFIIPSDVCYAAQGFDHRVLGAPYSSTWQVAARAVSYDYLWSEVRVKGGAYGAGFGTARTGNMRFYSYRDPHLDETLERFAGTADYLKHFNPTRDVMEGYVVSTVAGLDTPLKPRGQARRQDADYFSGRTPEQRRAARDTMIGTTSADIQSMAPWVAQTIDRGALCTFGSKDIIESARTTFDIIDLLNE